MGLREDEGLQLPEWANVASLTGATDLQKVEVAKARAAKDGANPSLISSIDEADALGYLDPVTPPGDAYNELILAQSPVALYDFEETGGTNLADSSGNGHDATLDLNGGTATLGVSGLVGSGKAIEFNPGGTFGSCPARARIPNAVWAQCLNAFTVELWTKYTGPIPANFNGCALWVPDTAAHVDFGFEGTTNFWLFADLFIDGAHQASFTTNFGHAYDHSIHYCVLRYNGSSLDGFFDAASIDSKPVTGTALNNGNPGYISGHPSFSGGFAGVIDKFAVYDHALTDQQISDHYATGIA